MATTDVGRYGPYALPRGGRPRDPMAVFAQDLARVRERGQQLARTFARIEENAVRLRGVFDRMETSAAVFRALGYGRRPPR